VTTYSLPEPTLPGFAGAEDQTDPFAIAGPVEPMTLGEFGEKVAGVAAGTAGGTAASAIGAFGDIAGIAKGVTDMIGAEEGKGFEAFLQGLSDVSSVIGSERTIKMLEEGVQALPISDEAKADILAGSKYIGETAGLPVGGSAALTGARRYIAGAPERVAERGTGLTLQSGFDPTQILDEMIVKGQGAIPVVKGVKPGDELLVQHNLYPESLEDIETLGGLPVPSLAIVKSSTPLEKFGSITLIGTPEMAKPSGRNPVYRSDAYAKRRPGITYEDMSRPTFYNQKTKKEQRATLKNMVAAMKGRAGEEMFGVTAGNLRAIAAKPFKTLAEVKRSRDRLVSEKDMMKVRDEIDSQYIGLINSVSEDIADIERNLRSSGLDFSDIMKGVVRGDLNEPEVMARLSDETKERIEIFRESAGDVPTEYFEINPQRAVMLDEFKVALVPEDISDTDLRKLRRSGVPEIVKYKDEADRREKIKSMRDLMFTVGATTVAGEQAISEMTGDQADITVTYPNEAAQ